jgi:RHH-type proline utilization regulon transcriptional repressor/proline dehydrogenase/delta 1-pyrroline-5-carboxylate dehydrogenase
MIGAVVGVQPFGGRGLSGTGPKAGGPLYLTRLVKDASVNTSDTSLTEQQTSALNAEIEQGQATASRIETLMTNAKRDELVWSFTELNTRTSILRQLLAQLAANKVVLAQESELPNALVAARAQILMIEKALAAPTLLPGPTGESNSLVLESRGIVACLRCEATPFTFWMMSIISAIASGNSVVALVDKKYLDEAEAISSILMKTGLPTGVFQVVQLGHLPTLLTHQYLAGAVVDNASPLKKLIGETLAARQGAILPLITAYTNKGLFQRLVTEKTITIDTTAAGGNASLMTMEAE